MAYFRQCIIRAMSTPDFSDALSSKSPGVLELGGARMALLDIQAGFWSIRRQTEALIGSDLAKSIFQQAGVNGGASFARSFTPPGTRSGLESFTSFLQLYQASGFGQFSIESSHWPIGHIKIRGDQTFESWMLLQNDQAASSPCCAYTTGVFVGFINIICGRKDIICIEHACQCKGDPFCEFELMPSKVAGNQNVVAWSLDPGIGRQINLLEILFERMPMGIAILDTEYAIQRYNPTWADFAVRYAPPSGEPLAPGVNYFSHLPGTETAILPLFKRALDGEIVRRDGIRLESGQVVTYWDIVLAPIVESDNVVGILNVAVDATERIESRINLERRVEDRTGQLKLLLDVVSAASSTLDLEELLNRTLGILVDLIGAASAMVTLVHEDTGEVETLIIKPDHSLAPEEVVSTLQQAEEAMAENKVLTFQPETPQPDVQPMVFIPLITRGRKLGALGIMGQKNTVYDQSQITLFKSVAEQMGVSIENAILFEQAEDVAASTERNRLARDLHDAVTQTLFSATLIAEVLPKIWDNDPSEGKIRLEELRQLTRGALSEMRTLLVELRPAAIADSDLKDLIRHQVNAFNARTRIPVDYQVNGAIQAPENIKEMFYRICQESLNNIAKHADASSVKINLTSASGVTTLLIEDDGVGFDLASARSEGLGLGIMAERAHVAGARFIIDSQIQVGTRLEISWQP